MSKHLVDVDEEALSLARANLGTATIRDTVNTALRLAGSDRDADIAAAFDVLGAADFPDRAEAWR